MSVLISIDRASLSLPALVLSGSDDANTLGVTNYVEPAMQARVNYAPTSSYVHGEQALGWAWQQTILAFDAVTDKATTEANSRALIAELRAAVTQFDYLVTVTVADAPAEVWRCQPGSLAPADGRSFTDLQRHNPVWSVTIPCHPIRSVA